MSNAEKILHKMRINSRDWRIEQVKTVAEGYGIEWRQRGTSHVVFIRPDGQTLPVPAHRPIKPIYIKKFVEFISG
ncbi:type II toxin-antitoxin system HicA family toxin [Chlorobaculum limnaeum]|jgi:predicted RNA binding protein YcfA (HicA-like mRNA interferase family)|uniref:type II toxin-antitoxin system HicA family toxin n=1 Tax=Chlorobaculum limnaeum TaxID=274537 RepID=UPI0009FD0F79|nr:type II toxin-antitoxin system HicA family toxin [Chlorobaculum limnaeum]